MNNIRFIKTDSMWWQTNRKSLKVDRKWQCDLDITINILQKYKNLYILLMRVGDGLSDHGGWDNIAAANNDVRQKTVILQNNKKML